MAVTTDGKIDPESSFYGDKSILVAKTGYGKSYTARVIIEEGVKKGHSFVVVDPQDAYRNIPEFEYIEADKVKSVKGLAFLLSQSSRNTVINVKQLTIEAQNEFMKVFLTTYKRHIRKGIQTLIIDEIHKFAPEGQNSPSKDAVRGLFQESRSDGLGIIGITQRPQRLDKTCLAQAEHFAVGRVTAFRDKESIKTYLDNPEDVEKLPKLEKGEFFFFGFGYEEPVVAQVRQAKTEHSGNSPKHLLNEDRELYYKNVNRYVTKQKGDSTMSDNVSTKNELVKGVVPSADGAFDLALMGMKASLGTAVSALAGNLIASRVASPLPVVSSRTLGSAATTVALYAGYRAVPMAKVKDVMKYAAAGSAAYTLGSALFDVADAANIRVPSVVSYALATATGASPINVEKKESAVDTNTDFA